MKRVRIELHQGPNKSRVVIQDSGVELPDVCSIKLKHRVGELPVAVVEIICPDVVQVGRDGVPCLITPPIICAPPAAAPVPPPISIKLPSFREPVDGELVTVH